MNCDGVRALMDAYLSNKMEFHEQMDLEIHIGMCEQCWRYFTEMEKVFNLVGKAFEHSPLPHDFAWRACEDLPEMVDAERIQGALSPESEIVTDGFKGLINILTLVRLRRLLFGRRSAWGRFQRRLLKWTVGGGYERILEWAKDYGFRLAERRGWVLITVAILALTAGVAAFVGGIVIKKEGIGRVIELTGTGSAIRRGERGGTWRSLGTFWLRNVIREGDTVKTDGDVQLTVGCPDDGTLMYIHGNSLVTFYKRRWIGLKAGDVFIDVMPGAGDFKITTDHGTISVIGTRVGVSISPDPDSTILGVDEGTVEVLPETLLRKAQEVGTGKCYQFGGTFTITPRVMGPSDYLQLIPGAPTPRVGRWLNEVRSKLAPQPQEGTSTESQREELERPWPEKLVMSVRGKVLDDASGNPLPRARITMDWGATNEQIVRELRETGRTPLTTFEIVSGRNGSYRRRRLPVGVYTVVVAHDDYSGDFRDTVNLSEPGIEYKMDIALRAGRRIVVAGTQTEEPREKGPRIVDITLRLGREGRPPPARPETEVGGEPSVGGIRVVEVGEREPRGVYCSISGRVTDASGLGISGARVSLRSRMGTIADDSTDDNGWYSFEELAPGTYTVSAVSYGYEEKLIEIPLREMGISRSNANITLPQRRIVIVERPPLDEIAATPTGAPTEPPGERTYVLTGLAEDSLGRSITRATVTVENVETGEVAQSMTRIDGSFLITGLVDGSYRVTASAPQFVGDAQEVQVPATRTVSFYLKAKDMIEGIVVGPTGEEGISGATVSIIGSRPPSSVVRVSGSTITHTMANGSFRFSNLPAGVYQLVAEASGFAPAYVDRVGNGTTDLLVSLSEGGSIGGIVLAETGEPESEASITATREVPDAAGQVPQKVFAVSGGDGRFMLANLMEGQFLIDVRDADGELAAERTVTLTRDQSVSDLALKLGRAVSRAPRPRPTIKGPVSALVGKVLDSLSNPVGGAWVCSFTVADDGTISESWEVTDRDGIYKLSRPAGGKRSLLVAMASGLASRVVELGIGGRDATGSRDIQLDKGATIRGRATDEDGTPIQGARVWCVFDRSYAEAISNLLSKETRTDPEGRYNFEGVAQGSHWVTLSAGNLGSVAEAVYVSPESARDAQEPINIDFSVPGEMALIRGTVRDSDGREVADATVRVSGEYFTATVQTDPRGDFVLMGLGERKVDLAAIHSQYGMAIKEQVAVGTQEVELRLGWGSVGGRVDAGGQRFVVSLIPSGSVAQVGGLGIERQEFRLPNGVFQRANVAPGTYDIMFASAGFAPLIVRGVKVSAGEAASVGEPSMRRGGSVSASVVDRATLAPLQGASVKLLVCGATDTASETMMSEIRLRTTDVSGGFKFDQVPEGRYFVVVTAQDYASLSVGPVSVTDGEQSVAEGVMLGKGGAIEGRLFMSTDVPAMNARLVAASNGLETSVRTDDAGKFTFAGLAEGEWTIRVDVAGAQQILGTVKVRDGRTTPTQQFQLSAAGIVPL